MTNSYPLKPTRPVSVPGAFLAGFLVFMILGAHAQLDTRHYMPPFYAKSSNNSDVDKHWAVLSTPSEDTIPVTIQNGYGEIIDIVNISRQLSVTYLLGDGNGANPPLNVIPTDSLNQPNRSQGLIFTSFQPFYVNVRHDAPDQGTSVTTKGLRALGQRFYSGHIHGQKNATSSADDWNNNRRAHFISVMATENNTTVTIDLIKEGIAFIGLPTLPDDPTTSSVITFTLDSLESYTVGVSQEFLTDDNVNDVAGTRITSDKDISVLTGSWLGGSVSGQCIGVDQIVPVETVGQEYIVQKGLGNQTTENTVVVATEDGTQVFINGQPDPFATINEGEFAVVGIDNYSPEGNLYVLASEPVYVYQTLSGSSTSVGPTVDMCFLPPLNCIGAKEVNIPNVGLLGTPVINIITKTGTSVFVNGSADPLTGSDPVPGNPDWETYSLDVSPGDWSAVSDSVMYVALITRDNNVGAATYFSGFTIEPVVGLSAGVSGSTPCIPGNATLQVFGFDTYQWYYNGEPIEGATGNTLIPQFPGVYEVDGIDIPCNFSFRSEPFDIPICPSDLGIAKEDVLIEETGEDTYIYDVTYRMNVVNYGVGDATNIQIIDDILAGLALGATAEVVEAPQIVFGFLSGDVNPDFDGITDQRLLSGTGNLPVGASDAIEFTVRINMANAQTDGYVNQSVVSSTFEGPNNGQDGPFTGSDFSHDGLNPDDNGNSDPTDDNDPTPTCFFENRIAYSEAVFCQSDENPVVAVDGLEGGDFTASDGLVIDTAGTILLAESTPGGPYTITYEVGGDCPTTETTQISIIPVPSAGEGTDLNLCENAEPVDLNTLLTGADAGGLWTDGSGAATSPNVEITEPGTFSFTYTVQAAPCAPVNETVTISVDALPFAGSIGGEVLCDTLPPFDLQSLVLTPGSAEGVFAITPSDSLQIDGTTVQLEGAPAGNYTVTYTVSGSGACADFTDVAEGFLTIEACEIPEDTTVVGPPPVPEPPVPLAIPQGFSPNGDGRADLWFIQGLNQFPANTVTVFNRWGAEVFNASPYRNDWDGSVTTGFALGEELPVGTYYYVLDLGDGSPARTGFVYLNR